MNVQQQMLGFPLNRILTEIVMIFTHKKSFVL